MGNLADHRRQREKKGLYKEDPGEGEFTKDELDYIPFLGNNPSKERPAVYTAQFTVSGGKIELEAKRAGGKLYVTCLADEKHNRAIFECVERFVKSIFDDSIRPTSEVKPSAMKILQDEVERLKKENEEHLETLVKLKSIMK
jgi:hypothetical protein